jgi:hypothetical protein
MESDMERRVHHPTADEPVDVHGNRGSDRRHEGMPESVERLVEELQGHVDEFAARIAAAAARHGAEAEVRMLREDLGAVAARADEVVLSLAQLESELEYRSERLGARDDDRGDRERPSSVGGTVSRSPRVRVVAEEWGPASAP